jgi:hypothetical protein
VLATRADDGEMRALLRRAVIPGAVRVAFTREPEFAAGEGLAGAEDATVVARSGTHLVGMGRSSVHTLHRNGRVQRIGYLGALRVDPGTPASPRLIRRGYALLAERASTVDGFFTSIAVDNVRGRRVLEHGGRFGLPVYRPLASLVTLVAPVARAARPDPAAESSRCRADERGELTAFLAARATEAHLTLSWDDRRWASLATHGITPQDFVVVRRGGRIVAAAAVWDQRSFRQTVIDGYAGVLRLARPLVNVVRAVARRPVLPSPGSVLAQGTLLGAATTEAADWAALWRAVNARAVAMGLQWVVLARDARDAHLPAMRALVRAREYHTTLYDVAWRDRPTWSDAWDARVFRPEAGLL